MVLESVNSGSSGSYLSWGFCSWSFTIVNRVMGESRLRTSCMGRNEPGQTATFGYLESEIC